MFFLLYKHTDESVFNDILRISTASQRFATVLQNFLEGHTGGDQTFIAAKQGPQGDLIFSNKWSVCSHGNLKPN